MEVWAALVLAISSNIDDLSFGFALGLSRRLPWAGLSIIALLSGITMGLGILAGQAFAQRIPAVSRELLAALVFVGIGLWFFWQGLTSKEEQEQPSRELSLTSALVLGLVLGIDSLIIGVSAGIAGFTLFPASLFAFLTSLAFIWFGSRFGSLPLVQRLLGKNSSFVSGALMFLLAVYELIG